MPEKYELGKVTTIKVGNSTELQAPLVGSDSLFVSSVPETTVWSRIGLPPRSVVSLKERIGLKPADALQDTRVSHELGPKKHVWRRNPERALKVGARRLGLT